MLDDFSYRTQFRVAFSDLDYMQHVNHLSFARWAEALRSDYFADVLAEDVNGEHGMILVKLDFSYERQVSLREQVAVGCRIAKLGRKSFVFAYEIWSADANVRCAFGTTTMVAFNYRANTSVAVPERWREKIPAFEKHPLETA